MATHKNGSHEKNCLTVCISCLKKVKSKFLLPLESKESEWEDFVSKFLYQDYSENKNYLPSAICLFCRNKLKNHKSSEEYPVFVDFDGLVRDVKKYLMIQIMKIYHVHVKFVE